MQEALPQIFVPLPTSVCTIAPRIVQLTYVNISGKHIFAGCCCPRNWFGQSTLLNPPGQCPLWMEESRDEKTYRSTKSDKIGICTLVKKI
jgi:hypothetical protein